MNGTSKKKLLKDIAYEKIKEIILKGEDEFTSENSLVEELKISRTPIREALQRLHYEGLVRIISNKGFVIPELSLKERRDISNMRIAIETYSLEQAIEIITDEDFTNLENIIEEQKKANKNGDLYAFLQNDAEFHQYLLEIVGNSMFINMYKNARERLFTIRDSKEMRNRPDVILRLIHEHEKILRFLKEKDIHSCKEELKQHLRSGINMLL